MSNTILLQGDVLEQLLQLPSNSINCCVTSPPYWGLRDYGTPGQLGLEAKPDEYVSSLVNVFREVKRVLREDGTLWLNLGDSFASVHTGGHKSNKSTVGSNRPEAQEIRQNKAQPQTYGLKPKDLVGIPWRVAFALQADGWYLRSDIIWNKPNAMPESVKDRPTKAHEYIFLLSKSERYYYNQDAIREPNKTNLPVVKKQRHKTLDSTTKQQIEKDPYGSMGYNDKGKNKRTVWNVSTRPFKEAHFAVFPPDLIRPCIMAGCPENGVVLDPFGGSGTVALVAKELNRNSIYIDIHPQYVEMARKRIETAL